MTDYHSALDKTPREKYTATQRHIGKSGVAFQHDLILGFPIEMLEADVLYAEPPWREGFDTFAKLAGVSQKGNYLDLLEIINKGVNRAKKPACVITGKHAIKYYDPHHAVPVILNGFEAFACLWNMEPFTEKYNTIELTKKLASEYEVVGDFCCGYGRTGRIFTGLGKKYILSDFDAQCIGYIAQHEASW